MIREGGLTLHCASDGGPDFGQGIDTPDALQRIHKAFFNNSALQRKVVCTPNCIMTQLHNIVGILLHCRSCVAMHRNGNVSICKNVALQRARCVNSLRKLCLMCKHGWTWVLGQRDETFRLSGEQHPLLFTPGTSPFILDPSLLLMLSLNLCK